jgi:predicted enzyme related to lactoylglutathione lyase
VTTRLFSVVFDSHDHRALAHFWARALEVEIAGERDDETWINVRGDVELNFVPASTPKTAKNRIHIDLHSASADAHQDNLDRLYELGAKLVDIGQGDVKWDVLADPEGNEFCVEPVTVFDDRTGPLGAISLDAADPAAQGRFWSAATGWTITDESQWCVCLRAPSGEGPVLTIWRSTDPMPARKRLHIDVAPFKDDDQEAEVERLIARGARRIDIGQGEVPWIVLADPEDNEFCILTPR